MVGRLRGIAGNTALYRGDRETENVIESLRCELVIEHISA